MVQIGTENQPLRVAIIGSGPSGFYAADHLLKQKDIIAQVDMFERLPTPFGLVRGGVAPDHQKIKSVTKLYDRIANKDSFRFYGNVTFGKDIHLDDLKTYYHAVIYAVGSSSDRKLGIEGEDLKGSHPATEFVGWYNAHPDYRDLEFDLSVEAIAVVGIGNVAMDVVRILSRSQDELNKTDIASYAQEALANSNVKRIYVLGRRGPAQAAFTNPEIQELGELEEADLIISERDMALDEASLAYLSSSNVDRKDARNVEILRELISKEPEGKKKQIILKFLTSPIEILGDDTVTGVKVVRNELYVDERGSIRPRATDETEIIPVGMIFRSVGYKGVALPDVPFYEKWGIIPNNEGRVVKEFGSNEQVTGNYVVGWIKRGPSGIIGTNKPDSVETANKLLEDVTTNALWKPEKTNPEDVEALLKDRKPDFISYADWQIIDQLELERGEAVGRPRVKFTDVSIMLAELAEAKK